jgi:hypothetical protein
MRSALLLVGYGVGGVVYLAIALWALRGARRAVRALVALYWRDRSRREVRATVQRVAAEAAPPERRAA